MLLSEDGCKDVTVELIQMMIYAILMMIDREDGSDYDDDHMLVDPIFFISSYLSSLCI